MPLRASSVPAGFDMKIYRTIQWGQLANFHMMDTRQYRDDQLAGDGWKKNVTERLAEDRTITGAEQEKWLLDGFRNSTQRWDILGQQVFFAEKDRAQAPEIDDVSMDGWDGYAASRRRITQGWVDANVRNAVVLTGDVHRNWANDLKVDYKDPASPVVGSELVCTSITLHRQRHRLHHGPHHGLEPAPEVLQRQPRLREHPHHQGCAHRRLPGRWTTSRRRAPPSARRPPSRSRTACRGCRHGNRRTPAPRRRTTAGANPPSSAHFPDGLLCPWPDTAQV